MKSREHIEAALTKEYHDRDSPNPMDEMDWAHNQGWIEALEFVLDINTQEQKAEEGRLNKIILTNKERNDIIGRTIQRLQSENQSLDDDVDIEDDCICSCGK